MSGDTLLERLHARLSDDAQRALQRAASGETITIDGLRRDLCGDPDGRCHSFQVERLWDEHCNAVAGEVDRYCEARCHLVQVDRCGRIHPRMTFSSAGHIEVTWPLRQVKAMQSESFSLASLTEPQRAAYESALRVLCPEDGDAGIVLLTGKRGTGKTLLACVLANNAWVGRGARAQADAPGPGERRGADWHGPLYFTVGDLFGEQKRYFNHNEGWEPLMRMRRADLICLDEIQERGGSEWEQAELTRLVDYRYRQCLPTILVGNVKPEELTSCLGPSIVSRLQETGALIQCDWESFRKKAVN